MRPGPRVSDERGAVLILVAIALPFVLVGFTMLVVEVGNWWVHKRHLQTQADAAALAGASQFRFPACDDAAIERTAIQYSGGVDPDNPTVLFGPSQHYNRQLGGTPLDKVHTVINEPSPYGRSDVADPDLEDSPGPCASQMLDVKMTETDLPFLIRALGLVEYVDAQARVELRELETFAGTLPIGVEEVSPKRIRVWVYDEDTGVELGEADLFQRTELDEGGRRRPYSEDGLLVYDNKIDNEGPDGEAGQPLTIDMREETIGGQVVTKQRLGLKVALSGSHSATCGDPLVLCYGSSTDGLARIRGHLAQGSATTVRLGEVGLLKGTCAANGFGAHDNGYFSTTCTSEQIKVELPALVATDNPTVEYRVQRGNTTTNWRTLTWDPADQRWVAGDVPVDPLGGGTRRIDVRWSQTQGSVLGASCSNGRSNPCQGEFLNAHKLFSGSRPRSGPIRELRVDTAAVVGDLLNDNNVARCGPTETCPATFTFRVGTAGRLELSDADDPPVSLRVFGEGSANQSLDCDPDVQQLGEEIAEGCGAQYTRNTGTACPATAPALWDLAQPWDCVAIQTGTNANAPASGLNERILCRPINSAANCTSFGRPATCTNPTQWPAYAAGDPRLVPVFLVPFGTFDSQGSTTVPVVDFALFYVTGWTSNGAGWQNPCKNFGSQSDVFVPGTEDDSGAMSGHFTKYASPNSGGSGGGGACDPDSISACVAVMTK